MQGLAQQTTSLSLAQAPITQQDMERKQAMKLAWQAYRGQFPKPLKIAPGQPDDNCISNFCVSIVDKGASWLFGQPLKITATEEAKTDASEIQDFIDGLWGDDDDKMTLLSDTAINGGVCGHAFLKLIPAQKLMKYPRIVVLDPQIVRIVTAQDDCSLILAYVIEYPVSADWQKRQIIARVDPDGMAGITGEYDLDDTWTISNYMRKGSFGDWIAVGAVETWAYPFPPIFSCKNLPNPNEALGTSDLTTDIIDQNKALNFLLSNLLRIVKYHGHPVTWIKGLNATQISKSIDDAIVLPSPESSIGTLTPMENFAGILSVIANIMSNIDQQSRIPAVALGRQEQLPKLGNISGVALSLMFQPFIEKTTQKQRTYGKMIREITRAALIVAGLIPVESFEDYAIELHWSPLLPNDNLQAAQEAVILQSLGISMSTILAGLGLDADDEAAKKAQEDSKKLDMFSKGQGFPPAPPVQPQQPGQAPGQQMPMQQEQDQQGGQP